MKKLSSWDKYSKFSADFETTHHKEFTQEEILNENRQSFALGDEVVDFTPNKSSQVFIAGLMSLKNYSYKLSFENIPDFFNNIVEMTFNEHHVKALVWFHNLVYDSSYILNWLLQHGYKQTLKIHPKTFKPMLLPKQFALLASGGKVFNLIIRWRGIEITFLDSLKLFPTPLADLGETIGYKKLKELVDYTKFELDKNHNYPENWLIYLKRDCEILAHYLNIFFEKEPRATSLKRQTIGSVAYSYIKKIVNQLIPHFTIADYKKFEWWFHGGLCFPSLRHWGKWIYAKGRIKLFDAVSMYSSRMNESLPYGEPLLSPPEDSTYCAFYKIHIKHANIKKKYDDIACIWKPFELDENGKKIYHLTHINTLYQYVQSVEDEDYYVIDKELDMWKQLYDIDYEIVNAYYFRTQPYLSEIIQMLFKAKRDASLSGDKINKGLAKLRLNNIYGKTSQKPNRSQDFYGDEKDIDTTKYKILGKKNTLYPAFNIERIKEDTAKAQPIFLGAYITASARVNLLTKYKYITDNKGIFLYSDTDSIFYVDNPKKPIQFDGVGNHLGEWEGETFITYKVDKHGKYILDAEGNKQVLGKSPCADAFCALCPKQYRVIKDKQVVKIATAGVKKDIMYKVATEDYNYDLGENKKYHIIKTQLKNSINGKVIWDSPFNFTKWKKYKSNPIPPKEILWKK